MVHENPQDGPVGYEGNIIYPLQSTDSMGFCGDGMVVNWTGYLQR